jgi:hypothetical protein
MPDYLYKYMSLEGERFEWFRGIVVDGSIYFPRFSELNDPLEGEVQADFSATPEEIRSYWKRVLSEQGLELDEDALARIEALVSGVGNPDRERELHASVRAGLLDCGVLSLTEAPDESLMWERYGNKGRGVCLRFSPVAMFIPEREGLTPPLLVKYVLQLPRPAFYRDSELKRTLDLMATKTDAWAVEQEWRVINTRGCGAAAFNHRALNAIILGPQLAGSDEDRIKTMWPVVPHWIQAHRWSAEP